MRILYLLIPEGLAELGSDFTGKYIIEEIASQVTVLRMYQPSGVALVVRRSSDSELGADVGIQSESIKGSLCHLLRCK